MPLNYSQATQRDRVAYFHNKARSDYTQDVLFRRGVELSENVTIRNSINIASRYATGQVAQAVSVIARTYVALLRNKGSRFTKMWDEVGQGATEATVAAYEDKTTGQGGNRNATADNQAYRANAQGKWRRDAGGKLKRALASKQMYVASPDGILFVNRTWLDQNARQWYRLNFGAGSRAGQGKRHEAKQITIFGQNAGRVSLKGYRPSAPFKMPGSLWMKTDPDQFGGFDPKNISFPDQARRGQDVLYPLGYALTQSRGDSKEGRKQFRSMLAKRGLIGLDAFAHQTRGIAAQAFLDTGLNYIAKVGFRRLERAYVDITNEALADANSATARVLKDAKVSTADIQALQKQHLKVIAELEGFETKAAAQLAAAQAPFLPG